MPEKPTTSYPLPIQQVLAIAAGEIGTTEVPRGSNRGPKIREYLAVCGLPEGYPWCAAFVAWCGATAAVSNIAGFDHWPLPLSADCDVLLFKARKSMILQDKPKVGDLFLLMGSRNDATHVGFVTGINADGSIQTIEGNSNANGSREGYVVAERPRRSVHNLKFVRWIAVVSAIASTPPKTWKVLNEPQEGPVRVIAEGENVFLDQGNVYIPVRHYLQKMGLPDQNILRWHDETQGLTYLGKTMGITTVLRKDAAWGQIRQIAAWNGLALRVDNSAKTITIFSV